MSLECGLIPMDELEHALRLTAKCQSPKDWQTKTGSFVPKGAIADHINFDATPIYFAGTYDTQKQGHPFGYYPCLDDHFYFVEMAWQLVTAGKSKAVLREDFDGLDLLARLDEAFAVPNVKGASDLVWCDEEKRGISFGFTDVVTRTG
ncbi:MAG: hypothetical protein JKX85_08515 [Phycisphaeraceae bacterium]|nr:hypothetical protein [Phycisphaeraceae bacterium]